MPGLTESAAPIAERTRRIHHEIAQLAVLMVIAGGSFLVTREIAAANQRARLRHAASWFARGRESLAAGDVDEAIAAFRRAAGRNRLDKSYGLALARALAVKGQSAPARHVLLGLREASPDDPEVSAELGRLAGAVRDVPEALRHYHAAIYSPWISALDRRRLRLELVRLLFAQKQTGRGLPELLAVSMDLPAEARPHVEVGQLFAAAEDQRHALAEFRDALRLDPDDASALAGAGLAAFSLGEYEAARKYLDAAPPVDPVRSAREVVVLILTRDPLASRIRFAERRQRLQANLVHVREKLAACSAPAGPTPAADEDVRLRAALEGFEALMKARAVRDLDTIESGADLTYEAANHVARNCPPPAALDEALMAIGRRHGVAER